MTTHFTSIFLVRLSNADIKYDIVTALFLHFFCPIVLEFLILFIMGVHCLFSKCVSSFLTVNPGSTMII